MASPFVLRFLIVPFNDIDSGGALDALLASIKAIVLGNTIYQQEIHSSDYTAEYAYLIFLSTAANDAIITGNLIPALAQTLGVPSLLTFSASALV